jgi:hypothetical protein
MLETCLYLEFTIGKKERFNSLHQLFSVIKREKDLIFALWDSDDEKESYDPTEEPNWIEFLDDEAIEWFTNIFDFNGDEGLVYQELWQLTKPEIRCSHPMFNRPGNWDFESVLDSLFNGEYTLVDLILTDDSNGILYYDPWAFPFGGSEPLVALIESFGHYVHFDSWHEGSHHRQVIGWDYSLAKNLVAKGQGFIPK